MTDRELERKLAQALEQAAPNDPQGVLSRCNERKGVVIPMKKKTQQKWKALAAACLAVVIIGGCGGIYYQQNNAVASVVSLDVNPSIELTVNQRERVIACAGLNEEASAVLADMENGAALKGADLDVAVNAIVGALVRNGYLEDISSAILISVEDKDADRAARLQQELTASVDGVLGSSGAAVLSQTVEKDKALEQQAKANNISTGKAALVERVQAINPNLQFEALAGLSVEELKDLAKQGAPAMPIGREAAVAAAAKVAGMENRSDVLWEADPELDEVRPHYEVELKIPGQGEYEYLVDAFTGEIISSKADPQAQQPAVPTSQDIGPDYAAEIAIAHAGYTQAEVSGLWVERSWDDGRLEYEVDFRADGKKFEYEVASDGKSLERSVERDVNAVPEQPSVPANGSEGDIGRDAAVAAALKHAGLSQSQISGLWVEKDRDDGRLEYEVDFRSGGYEYEYSIDAASGAVLEHEKDIDD